MLAASTYPQDYIDARRRAVADQLTAYDALVAVVPKAKAAALAPFETQFLANLVLALDEMFVHRTRAVEGKDGNPCNEVRMLSTSILLHERVLTADKTIKYRADQSVLGLEVGDPIVVDRAGFGRLADAYFAEIERRFT
jgi:hypothetical protein